MPGLSTDIIYCLNHGQQDCKIDLPKPITISHRRPLIRLLKSESKSETQVFWLQSQDHQPLGLGSAYIDLNLLFQEKSCQIMADFPTA